MAASRLVPLTVPNFIEGERSSSRISVSSRSSTKRLMKGRPWRAVTFQSIERISSPTWYSRTSSNSMPRPRKALRYSPAKMDVTRREALICKRLAARLSMTRSTRSAG